MASTKKKMGRKAQPFVCPWNGETIDGLYLCPDGRWRITETGDKFREPNPKQAVARFRQWQAQRRGDQRFIPLPFQSMVTTVSSSASISERDVAHARLQSLIREVLGSGDYPDPKDGSLTLRIPVGSDPVHWLRALPEDAYFACVAEDIRTKAKYVAERTGIEQIGYLQSIEKPEPSPSLREVGEYFFGKKQHLSDDWLSKCRAFWKEFSESVGVPTVREVTRQHVEDYGEMLEETVRDKGFQPPYIRQRLEAIRSIANLTVKKQKWEEDCRRLGNRLGIIDKPAANSADPRPMKPKMFRTLLDGADDFMRAVLLVGLNLCMYSGEVGTIKWSELNFDKGTFLGSRPKTGVVRVGVLWPRTIEALSRIPRDGEAVFIAVTGIQHNYKTIYPYFKRLREATGVEGAQFSEIRDGAYTTACEHPKVKDFHAEVLAGHQTGIKDRYVKRRPKMVSRACRVIEAAYFPEIRPSAQRHSGDTNGTAAKPVTDRG